MRFFIVGLPGSGKTFWGRKWAVAAKTNYFDLDDIIEENEGESIPDIFAEEGEEYFRNLEEFYLNKLIDNYTNVIVSCGGGTVTNERSVSTIKANGHQIYLNLHVSEVAKNLLSNQEEIKKRPLFKEINNEHDLLNTLENLLKKRKVYYSLADFSVSEPTKNTILDIIKKVNR